MEHIKDLLNFNTNKKYIIQFSKKNCYFCEKLEKVEEKLKFIMAKDQM